MPQLDFSITFPQIFWLIIIFFFIYTVLVHFFLPSFVKSIKSRKYVILVNEKEIVFLKNNFFKNQSFIEKLIQKNFNKLRFIVEKEFIPSNSIPKLNMDSADIKITLMLYHNTLYYHSTVIKSISLEPNFLNLKI